MRSRARHLLAMAPGVLAVLLVPLVQRATADESVTPTGCRGLHWVAAWTGAPQGSSLGRPDDAPFGTADGPARAFVDQTLRMVVRPAASGDALRVRFSNRFGDGPLELASATVAQRSGGAAIDHASLEELRFGGNPAVAVPAGGTVVSDPVFLDVRAGTDLAVSFHVAGAAALDHHQWASSTQYAAPTGVDHAFDPTGEAFDEELTGWYGVTGVDVLAPRSMGVVVAIGDSITDGIGSSPNLHRRWPDRLNERLRSAEVPLATVNAGIAGNHVVTSGLESPIAIGPSIVDRLDADALGAAGATDLVVFAGINDIYMSGGEGDIAARVVEGYRAVIDAARGAGLRVIGATVTPASMTGAREAARVAVNEWIRSSGEFDAVVDLDAVARDPEMPARLRPAWDAGMAHLTDAGYAALAASFDLDSFQGTGC